MRYFYLHGFASGPESAKAKYFRARFRRRGLPLNVVDFNQDNFFRLTLTRQIDQVSALILESESEPVTLIGSSFGGLTAAWVAEQHVQVERLVLLAPAFEFLSLWLRSIGDRQVRVWRDTGSIPIYHHAYQKMMAIHYGIVEDLSLYSDFKLTRTLPTRIIHGLQDPVIPIDTSRRYAETRPWVSLRELNSDHSLGNVVSRIWKEIQTFCSIP